MAYVRDHFEQCNSAITDSVTGSPIGSPIMSSDSNQSFSDLLPLSDLEMDLDVLDLLDEDFN